MKAQSASQNNKFRGCKRRWGFEYLEGRKEGSTAATRKGTSLHRIQQNYLEGKKAIPDTELGQLARMGLPHLPHPKKCIVEGWFVTQINGITYNGAIDIWEPEIQRFSDHKTTSNFKYAINSDAKFLDDTQYLVYAKHKLTPRGRWIYYLTKGAPASRAFEVSDAVHMRDVDAAFDRIVHPISEEIIQIRKKGLRAWDLPGNIDNCNMYPPLGCPHKSYCNPLSNKEPEMPKLDADLFDSFEDETKVSAPAVSINPPARQPAKPAKIVAAPAAAPKGDPFDDFDDEPAPKTAAKHAPAKTQLKAVPAIVDDDPFGSFDSAADPRAQEGPADSAPYAGLKAAINSPRAFGDAVTPTHEDYKQREDCHALLQAALVLGAHVQAAAALREVLRGAL